MNAEPNANNNNEPEEVDTRQEKENMEKAKNAQILGKLSDFEENFTSLEDLTDDTEVFEFIMKNWSTKDIHKKFIINAEMLKWIKDLIREFINSNNELTLKKDFGVRTKGKSFIIEWKDFIWLENTTSFNIYILYKGWSLIFKKIASSLNAHIASNTQKRNKEIYQKKLSSLKEIFTFATDLYYDWIHLKSKKLQDSGISSIETEFNIELNKIISWKVTINGSEFNYNDLDSKTKSRIEKSVIKWRDDFIEENTNRSKDSH